MKKSAGSSRSPLRRLRASNAEINRSAKRRSATRDGGTVGRHRHADPHAVMGCRMITRTVKGYDIRESEEWRQLQEEAAHRGGNTVLVSLEGDRKGDIFACKKP